MRRLYNRFRRLTHQGQAGRRGNQPVKPDEDDKQRLQDLKSFLEDLKYEGMNLEARFNDADGSVALTFSDNQYPPSTQTVSPSSVTRSNMVWSISEVTEIDKEAARLVLEEKYKRKYGDAKRKIKKTVKAQLEHQKEWWDMEERLRLLRNELQLTLAGLEGRTRGASVQSSPENGQSTFETRAAGSTGVGVESRDVASMENPDFRSLAVSQSCVSD